jgi:DNA-binding NarL/FixJ family response regulator
MASEELEVIAVDDHLAMRRGIELLLREAGFRIAGVAGTLEEARAILSRRRFDLVLLDVQLGQESSVSLVEDLLREDPESPIVVHSGSTGSDSMLHEAVRAGARGFGLKTSAAPHLTDALRALAAGGTYVDPELAEQLADGLNGQMIAERLLLSPETVHAHLRNATAKPDAVVTMLKEQGYLSDWGS